MCLAMGARMQSNMSRGLAFDDSRRSAAPSRRASAVVRTRMTVAGVLTLAVIAIGVLIGITLGRLGLSLYVIALPVPLCVLWLAADAVRADERESDR